jgi:hypothetical protein
MNSCSAVVRASGVWLRVQGAGRFVPPTDRMASDSTRVSASGRSTTLASRPSRTLRNLLTRRTVSADRSHGSHGSAQETRPLPESIVFLAAVLSSPQPARTSNGHAWRVSFRIAAVQRQLARYEANHHRRLEPLTPEARISQKVVAQITHIPHRPVCRIKCTCPGFLGRQGNCGQGNWWLRDQKTDTRGFGEGHRVDSRAAHSLARNSLAHLSPNSATDRLTLSRRPAPQTPNAGLGKHLQYLPTTTALLVRVNQMANPAGKSRRHEAVERPA